MVTNLGSNIFYHVTSFVQKNLAFLHLHFYLKICVCHNFDVLCFYWMRHFCHLIVVINLNCLICGACGHTSCTWIFRRQQNNCLLISVFLSSSRLTEKATHFFHFIYNGLIVWHVVNALLIAMPNRSSAVVGLTSARKTGVTNFSVLFCSCNAL